MYLDHFKLKELPFRLGADARFHFLGVMQEMVKSQLRHGLVDSEGCILLTGEAGVGKSIAIDDLIPCLADHYRVIQIKLPDVSVTEFYQAALAQLGEATQASQRAALMNEFETCLERHAAARRIVVVVLDGSESAAADLLQELFKLTRRSSGSVGNLRVLLAGRPSLEHQVARAAASVAPPVMHLRLSAFEPRDTRRYLRHRLEIAGAGAGSLFDDECDVEIQRYTGGVPRLINTLADAALVQAFNRNRSRVSTADVRAAVDQLQWVEYSARTSAAPQMPVAGLAAAPSPDGTVGRLRIEREGQLLAQFDLPVGKVSLGRAKSNDVRIDSQFISRHHCHILTTRQYSVIEDLQSQNGIVVGGRRISVHRLRDGDEVELGDHRLIFSKVEGVPLSDGSFLFPMVLTPDSQPAEQVKTRVLDLETHLVRPLAE